VGLYLSRFRPLATEAPFCSDYVVVALVPHLTPARKGGHLPAGLVTTLSVERPFTWLTRS